MSEQRQQQTTETHIPTEIYSRVSGYFRPTNQWNKAKREEYGERKKAIIKTMEDIRK